MEKRKDSNETHQKKNRELTSGLSESSETAWIKALPRPRPELSIQAKSSTNRTTPRTREKSNQEDIFCRAKSKKAESSPTTRASSSSSLEVFLAVSPMEVRSWNLELRKEQQRSIELHERIEVGFGLGRCLIVRWVWFWGVNRWWCGRGGEKGFESNTLTLVVTIFWSEEFSKRKCVWGFSTRLGFLVYTWHKRNHRERRVLCFLGAFFFLKTFILGLLIKFY